MTESQKTQMENSHLSQTALATLFETYIGNIEDDLKEFILENDSKHHINDRSINENTATITTTHAQYTIPIEQGYDNLNEEDIAIINSDETTTMTCNVTNATFELERVPKGISEHFLEAISRTWADKYL